MTVLVQLLPLNWTKQGMSMPDGLASLICAPKPRLNWAVKTAPRSAVKTNEEERITAIITIRNVVIIVTLQKTGIGNQWDKQRRGIGGYRERKVTRHMEPTRAERRDAKAFSVPAHPRSRSERGRSRTQPNPPRGYSASGPSGAI